MNQNSEQAVLAELEDGRLTADIETGHVFRRGKHVGKASSSGYLAVFVPSAKRYVLAHRIVWMKAHGAIPRGLVINHKNRRRWDNRLINLEAITQRDNVLHGSGSLVYTGIRPEDLAAVDPTWLADILARAQRGESPPERGSGEQMPMVLERRLRKYNT